MSHTIWLISYDSYYAPLNIKNEQLRWRGLKISKIDGFHGSRKLLFPGWNTPGTDSLILLVWFYFFMVSKVLIWNSSLFYFLPTKFLSFVRLIKIVVHLSPLSHLVHLLPNSGTVSSYLEGLSFHPFVVILLDPSFLPCVDSVYPFEHYSSILKDHHSWTNPFHPFSLPFGRIFDIVQLVREHHVVKFLIHGIHGEFELKFSLVLILNKRLK